VDPLGAITAHDTKPRFLIPLYRAVLICDSQMRNVPIYGALETRFVTWR